MAHRVRGSALSAQVPEDTAEWAPNGGFVRYRLEILATLRGEFRTGYYLHCRLIAIFVGVGIDRMIAAG